MCIYTSSDFQGSSSLVFSKTCFNYFWDVFETVICSILIIGGDDVVHFEALWFFVACVADETKPRYSPSANQRPKACSALPGFSIIGSYWLLHMAVLSCTKTGRVAWNHGYAGSYTT